ncbi:RNA-directed DNA polymerase [Marinimicrobium sp. C6131]|uniref:antiviral reverse transcriptase Drt3a n=1 Tax=Marinimicrobium sp. C6131 TaxID=3022676 RepID=UPI00223D2FE6|nr:antiviral reverse transcriptase Drt3a [Marinimicrobium sp. C6131]UZJ42922.1 RNA-directed DNA polymerase [Marinimicrobium sp. C6131]
MLDQSFSATNFLKIVDIENRKGNYLEGDFFPDVEEISKEIQVAKNKLRNLKKKKSTLSEEEYVEKKEEAIANIENLKGKKEDLLNEEMNKVSSQINSKGFSFGIKEVDVGLPKKVYVAEHNAATYFALKQVQNNIRRLYKVKQENRHQIVCQLREILGDRFPKYILRTDISSFYESIPRKHLLKKLRDDPLLTLSSKKIIRRILFEYSAITGSDVGLPRGIGISAYLAELYMRDIDRTIRDYPGVLYYARYVDDIIVIFCPPPNTGTMAFKRSIVTEFKRLELTRNKKKTQIIKSVPGTTASVQYLGYKYKIGSGSLELRMTDKKIDRYKKRIDLTFAAYAKKANMPKKTEMKARALLEKRVRFLTSNTRLVNNKKNVVSGIFFSNSLLTKIDDLQSLDKYLAIKIAGLTNPRLQNRLYEQSFEKGFKTREYHKFSAQDLSKIVEVWSHVS